MQKHKMGSRSSQTGKFDGTTFLVHVLRDLRRFLPTEIALLLAGTVVEDPGDLRSVVSEETRIAESSLAEGGLERYVALRQIDALLAKNVDWFGVGAQQTKAAALRGFSQAERSCRRANRRIAWYSRRPSRLSPAVSSLWGEVQLTIQEILGQLDEGAYGEILDAADFGPGATFAHRVETGDIAEKLDPSYKHSVTKKALPYVVDYAKRNPGWMSFLSWAGATYETVMGNRVTTVPKKWNIDRTIGVEPSLNVFLQKGLGTFVAKRLARWNVWLSDQTPNQVAAAAGSIGGLTATLDLSAASDCIALEAVRWLFPPEWFKILDDLRSPWYQLSGEWNRYEKFSSMGNGFTFPLESLLFYAVCRTAVRACGANVSDIRVYGDDLIVPIEASGLTIEMLAFLGFRVNSSKSHFFGPFRESCGADYVHGVDVRPVYLESFPKNQLEINNLYNRLLVLSCLELPSTLEYLRSVSTRTDWIPGDFGIKLLKGEGWQPGVSLKVTEGMIGNPPEPEGYCSSVQSAYYTYTETLQRSKPVPKARFHWFTHYLSILRGRKSEEALDVRNTFVFRRVGFSFTWLSVDEIRGARLERRLRHVT